jgi:hypothetical protein
MSYDRFLENIPVWGFFIFITVIALLPIEVGLRWGARQRRKSEQEPEGPIGNVVAATLALLGFMVALTVGSATARFDSRKQALIDGVNAIETAFRVASLLPEPHKSECRRLFREYVDMRLEMPKLFGDPVRLRALDTRIRSVQQSLWSHAVALAEENRSCSTYTLYASSLNEVIKIHNKRLIIGAQYRIPFFVWAVLIFVTIITMLGVGFRFGLAGTRNGVASLILGLAFALVMTLIFDLDQLGKGFIDVSQQPMYELHERMQAEP